MTAADAPSSAVRDQRPGRAQAWVLAALVLATFAFASIRFDGPARGYWDTYITAPAMFMTGQPVQFVLRDGSPAWDIGLRGVLPDDLVSDEWGIITRDQRLGSPVVAAPLFAAFGLLGFRLLFALSVALLLPCAILACRSLLGPEDGGSWWPGLSAGAVLAWNPYVLSIDRLNPNLLVLPLALLLLHLLARRPVPAVATGVVLGVFAGIREEAVCFVPAIALWVLLGGPDGRPAFRRRLADLATIGGLTLAAMLPVFFWKWYAFGNPLLHPSQYPHFEGFRPEFVHGFLGHEFRFNGLLGWPLHDHLVRTPHFGYPTFLLFPLVTLRSLGLLLCAVLAIGLAYLARRRWRVALLCVAWALPVFLLFAPQENWEEVKMTFLLLCWPPLVPLLAAGLAALRRTPLPRAAGWLSGLTFALLLLGRLAASVDAPADDRWYVRFPGADPATSPSARVGLDEADRNDWVYFQSTETSEEVARERDKLSRAWPWPARYLPVRADAAAALRAIRSEAGVRDLRVLEIWGYIYGDRR